MLDRIRKHSQTIIVAMITAAVTATAPTIAGAAYDAVNADKVDGKHAVGAGATVKKRKGKLVATKGTTGLLPNNIIAKAPNADKLDGIDSSRFVRGTGRVVHGAIGLTEFSSGSVLQTPSSATPKVDITYLCGNFEVDGTVRITNTGTETLNLFSDNGGANPNDYRQLATGQSFDQGAALAGEHITFQVQGDGVATIEVFSVHQGPADCYAQAQGVFSH
jgi:hypothetical protein